MSTILSPESDIINKYLSVIASKSNLLSSKIGINGSDIYIVYKDTILYEISIKEFLNIVGEGFIDTWNDKDLPTIYNSNKYIFSQISLARSKIYNNIGECKASIINAMSSDITFNNIISNIKADDGCVLYKLNGKDRVYFIPLFSSFPNLNKSDDIDIFVYDDLENPYRQCIIKEVIHKKKINNDINIYFKALKF